MKRILTYPELKSYGVMLCRRQIDRLEAQRKFPRRVPISEGRVGWVETEIVEHVDQAIARRSTTVGQLGSSDTETEAKLNRAATLEHLRRKIRAVKGVMTRRQRSTKRAAEQAAAKSDDD